MKPLTWNHSPPFTFPPKSYVTHATLANFAAAFCGGSPQKCKPALHQGAFKDFANWENQTHWRDNCFSTSAVRTLSRGAAAVEIPNGSELSWVSLLLCISLALQPSTNASSPQRAGQRFQIVVPPKIQTLRTPSRFRLRSSVPIAMVMAVTKKSGRTTTGTRILHPEEAHYDLSMATDSDDSESMVLTICPL